jgi:tRNA 2-thiouridine synthesizing protein A
MSHYLDTKGLSCPLPVLKTRKKISSMTTGETLVVEATDPASLIDFVHYCHVSGNELTDKTEQDGIYTYHIKKID